MAATATEGRKSVCLVLDRDVLARLKHESIDRDLWPGSIVQTALELYFDRKDKARADLKARPVTTRTKTAATTAVATGV